MNGEFLEALQQIAKEKDIPLETLVETVESAQASAFQAAQQVGFREQVVLSNVHGSVISTARAPRSKRA